MKLRIIIIFLLFGIWWQTLAFSNCQFSSLVLLEDRLKLGEKNLNFPLLEERIVEIFGPPSQNRIGQCHSYQCRIMEWKSCGFSASFDPNGEWFPRLSIKFWDSGNNEEKNVFLGNLVINGLGINTKTKLLDLGKVGFHVTDTGGWLDTKFVYVIANFRGGRIIEVHMIVSTVKKNWVF